jgi:hypothetical protein
MVLVNAIASWIWVRSETGFLTKVGFPLVSFGEKPGFLDLGEVRNRVFNGSWFSVRELWGKTRFLGYG